jgi:hypothetical protein
MAKRSAAFKGTVSTMYSCGHALEVWYGGDTDEVRYDTSEAECEGCVRETERKNAEQARRFEAAAGVLTQPECEALEKLTRRYDIARRRLGLENS